LLRRFARSACCASAVSLLIPATAAATFGDPWHEFGAEPRHSRVFPIDGPHDLGRNAANRFGGGRGHLG
jgi:hypothetical protein